MKKIIFLLSFVAFISCEKTVIENQDQGSSVCLVSLTEFFTLEKLQNSVLMEYDSQNQIVLEKYIDPDKSIRNVISYKNEYDNDKKLIKVLSLRKDNTVFSTTTFTYHSNGKIKTKNTSIGSNSFDRYEYNIAGKIILNEKLVDGKNINTSYTYQANDLLTEEVLKVDNIVTRTIKKTYTSDGNLLKNEIISGSSKHITEYQYDQNSKLSKISNNLGLEITYTHTLTTSTYLFKQSGKYQHSFRDEFNTDGKIQKKYQSLNGTDFVLMNEYQYHPNKELSQENQYYFTNNSKTQSHLIVETKFNEKSMLISRTTFDTQGKIIDQIKNTILCK